MKQFRLFTLFALFILISSSICLAQAPKNYEVQWKKVEEYVKKNLPASALTEVKKIYTLAKKEKQDAQVIKSLLYITDLQSQIREDNEVLSIGELEKEVTGASEPLKSLLYSIIAEKYWNYYQSNRWGIYDRTATVSFKKEDIATWTAQDFFKKVSELYLLSLKNEKQLEQTSLEGLNAIIIKGNVRHLRPTLYDFLAQRALEYFSSNERDINRPAYAFEINTASAFDPAADFIHRKFDTNDSLSLYHKALLIYQKLIALHLNDKKHDALIDVDLQRYEFVRSYSTHPEKETYYFNGVNHIAHQYGNTPAAAKAWYLVAQFYENRSQKYSPFADTSFHYDRRKAKEICEGVLAQKDSSEGRVLCFNLLEQITAKKLNSKLEVVNVPNYPFRAQIEFQNLNKIYLRVIKVDDKLKKSLKNQDYDKIWNILAGSPIIRNWEQRLPDSDDYLEHTTEIKIDSLPVGEYFLIASEKTDLKSAKNPMSYQNFYVSNISAINQDKNYFVLDRNTGKPLGGTDVQVWEEIYDNKTAQNKDIKFAYFKADKNGFFKLEIPKTQPYVSHRFKFEYTTGKDRLFIEDYNYYYYNPDDNKINTSKPYSTLFFFSDRSIYRPGQLMYFKGILIQKNSDSKGGDILKGEKVVVYLRDANSQLIDSLSLVTNEFGSVSGKFQLPASGKMNGNFSLYSKTTRGSLSFRVEEYKRPKFYAEFEPVKETYKVNDTVSITGFAKAYAGNNIDGAKVKYRVVRQPRFIYWRSFLPPTTSLEITHGELTTDKDGKYSIRFKAIPDLKIDRKLNPVFEYRIHVDITDINGETRTGDEVVSVSYQSVILKVTTPVSTPADSLKSIAIRTENLNGQFVPTTVRVIISKLKPEERLIRTRLWSRQDLPVMTKAEYIRYFPNDEYSNESDMTTWPKEKQVFERTDSVRQKTPFVLTGLKAEPGFYVVEVITKDVNGDEIKDQKFIELSSVNSKTPEYPQYLWKQAANAVEPGENAIVKLGSSADNLFLIQQINKGNTSSETKPNYSFTRLSNEKKDFVFPVTEADRGGYGVNWIFIKHNRVYQYAETIEVPWTNKELNIEYATYRDKVLPGAAEKWKLKISGYKNEKVAAELLASMYDASLDQFDPHSWYKPAIYETFYNRSSWSYTNNFHAQNGNARYVEQIYKNLIKEYDYLIYVGYNPYDQRVTLEIHSTGNAFAHGEVVRKPAPALAEKSAGRSDTIPVSDPNDPSKITRFKVVSQDEDGMEPPQLIGEEMSEQGPEVAVRKNFNETAFFFPELHTDSSGAIEFSFTMPEALTKWKFLALAHTKDLAFGLSSTEIVTQKELMVQPNAPRFLREGDKMEFSAKIVNMSDKEMTGTAEFQLFDAATNEPVDGRFQSMVPNQYFTVAAGKSEAVKFPIEVPFQFNKAVVWRIVAKAGNYSDGEESALPVLTNRMLVTESITLPMKGNGTKEFKFDKLLNAANSESLQHHALTIEYTSNPAWYAVQALPYLMEYPYECAEQNWNRYYANSLASMIANSSPKMKQIFEQWKNLDTSALLSNLQKNEELKAVLLEETPWVLAAKTESQQKKNLALLFDMYRMNSELNNSYEKLKQMQADNGSFAWFKGGSDDRYITQYIVTGIGHLKKVNAISKDQQAKLKTITDKAIEYLDSKIRQDYNELVKNKTDLKKYVPSYSIVQYFYMRSFFPEYKIPSNSLTAYNYFISRLPIDWMKQNKYMQGMIALALHRKGYTKNVNAILKSLKETSIVHDELGRYWKDASRSWWWHEAPIERQALLIEVFQEAGKDLTTVDELRTWLLKNKQTNNWESTKATAEACYALLLQGNNWLNNEPVVSIRLGNNTIKSGTELTEAGTGYFKKTIDGPRVFSSMGNISVTVSPAANSAPSTAPGTTTWGAAYWQYFEDLDKITSAATPLKLEKKLFVETNTDRGPVLKPLTEGESFKIGDKIKVRIELRVDRDMEYVHMKDMRASGLEPVNVLSGYRWQGGLGYYETTKDASTNFFFSNLRKGTYVFEYSLFASQAGNFSNGVTTIQSMYAPEFSAHSEGIRINIE